jgi:hypothetical protein
MMDKEMDGRDAVQNKVYPLKLAYIDVVDRSQQRVIGKKSIGTASHAEKK